MDCMHAERKEQSVFLFFTVNQRKIEIIYKKAERTDDQMIRLGRRGGAEKKLHVQTNVCGKL